MFLFNFTNAIVLFHLCFLYTTLLQNLFVERCNDGRKKRKRVEGYNLAANKIRDARCERNRGIERIEYNIEYDEERMNRQGEKQNMKGKYTHLKNK